MVLATLASEPFPGGRSRSGVPRRSGCQTCKERHKKCDEQKPQCANCTRLGLACKQSDAFRASRLSRSNISRAKLPKYPPDMAVDSKVPSKPVTDAILPSSVGSSLDFVFEVIPSQWMDSLSEITTSSMERYLMLHYIERSASVLVNVDGPTNCLRSVILPRVGSSRMLLSAVYALSALHVQIDNGDPKYRTTSLRYYTNAINAVRGLIAGFHNGVSVQDRENVLLTSVFLCKFEIISGGFQNWRSHIVGTQRMLRLFQTPTCGLLEDVVSYVQSFVSYHSSISGITSTRRYIAPSEFGDHDKVSDQDFYVQKQVDPYMGFCADYITLLHFAAQTIAAGCTQEADFNVLISVVMRIYQDCSYNARQSDRFEIPGWLSKEATSQLDFIADAYRNVLVVYAHNILNLISETQLDDANIMRWRQIHSLLPYTKDEAISACLGDIMCVPEETPRAVGLCPLLFVVAIETTDQDEFCAASRRLTRLWETTSLGNIRTALDLLARVREGDARDWRQFLKYQNWDFIIS